MYELLWMIKVIVFLFKRGFGIRCFEIDKIIELNSIFIKLIDYLVIY